MSSTMRCPRCAAMLPSSAHFCRRCGAAQGQVAARSTPPPIQIHPASANRSRVGWFTVLGFFGLVGGGVMLMNQETSTPSPQIAPVISPQVVYPQTVMPAYPDLPKIVRPVYPDRSAPPVYPEHDSSRYDSHDHERERR